MKIDFERRLDRYVGTFLCWIFSLFSSSSRAGSALVKADSILVILLSEMGSLVLAHPMFQQIKTKFPGATIYGLLFEKNREVLELLNVTPVENILTINEQSFLTFVRDCISVFIQMRRIKIDIVIDCELFTRISSIFSFLSGARIRVGFHRHTQEGLYRGSFINRPVLYNPYQHISKQFVTLVHAIDSNSTPKSKQLIDVDDLKAPIIHFDQEEIKRVQARLYNDFRNIQDKKLVLIYPGGGILPIRAWPLDYYCEIAKHLLQRGYAVAVIGLVDDKKRATAILSQCKNPACIDLTGYTGTVRELMLIFQCAALLITNDGGPGQFAGMARLPSIIFYGPETPQLYGPGNEKASIFYEPLPCTPCLTAYNHRNSPCDGDNLCLKQIHPGRVLAKALEILEKNSS